MKSFRRYVTLRRVISLAALALLTAGALGFSAGGTGFFVLSRLQLGRIFTAAPIFSYLLVFLALLLTAFCGRVYCSFLCPLGAAQDVSAWFRTRFTKGGYSYRRPSLVRYFALVLLGGLFLTGTASLVFLLPEPFSLYSRGVIAIFAAPLEYLHRLLNHFGVYYYLSDVQVELFGLAALLPLAAVCVLAFFRGRLFCNTLCPVGALLGCVSRGAYIAPRIGDECVGCGKCASVCKAECIDVTNRTIDASRCVMCGNCAAACSVGALKFTKKETRRDERRREFLQTAGITLAVAMIPFVPRKLLPSFAEKFLKEGTAPSLPAGAMSWRRFAERCMGCQVCVSNCPSKVLRPAGTAFGIGGAQKPTLDFSRGFCQYDCVECGSVCPAGAIMKLTPEEKHKIQTGVAVYNHIFCIIVQEDKSCGACAEHCPTGAIHIPERKEGDVMRPVPEINRELCVGCGACEHVCPLLTQKAITVTPLALHQEAKLIASGADRNIEDDGFKF